MGANRKRTPDQGGDTTTSVMAALLPIHSAITAEWLADAATIAADRTLGAPYTFVYFEEQDGSLARIAPASDLARRSFQRAIDAIGGHAGASKLDPKDSPALAAALDTPDPTEIAIKDVFGVTPETAAAATRTLGSAGTVVAPLETAGERIGALVLLTSGAPNLEHARLLSNHVACAAVNLRQAQAAADPGAEAIGVSRTLFDAGKLERELQREIARAERYKRQVSIVVIEATNLRLLRERFGAFLVERLMDGLGESLAQHARDIDLIGAYRESGFTMVLTEAAADGAANAARRLLARAIATELEGEQVPGLELHLAAGWATFPTDGATTDALFAAAQQRMYGASTTRVA
jgi:diguanylate cyclase (GGDEF)-like protein